MSVQLVSGQTPHTLKIFAEGTFDLYGQGGRWKREVEGEGGGRVVREEMKGLEK